MFAQPWGFAPGVRSDVRRVLGKKVITKVKIRVSMIQTKKRWGVLDERCNTFLEPIQ